MSKPTLLQELFLLGRDAAIAKIDAVFDGQTDELCLRTRYPREANGFVTACLARRDELERGAGERCLFVRDRETWQRLVETATPRRVLIADPALDFETHRSGLLKQARTRGHSVIYALTSPRPDIQNVVDLPQPEKHAIEDVLKRYGYAAARIQRLVTDSSGNVYLLSQLLSGTTERRRWATADFGPRLRHLSLLGGWNDSSPKDRSAVAELVGESYDSWVAVLYPFTRQEEPPVILDGVLFRPMSRYELWQQLGPFLSDADVRRLGDVAKQVLTETEPELELPKEQRKYASFRREAEKEMCSRFLRRNLAETLALLGGQYRVLQISAGLGAGIADATVRQLLFNADWKRWASLSDLLPLLAEAAPDQFIAAVEHAVRTEDGRQMKALFGATEDPLFGRTYHSGLLWALETLAWHPDYLARAALCLAAVATYPLPSNFANNGLNSLRHIFLTWLPQTLAPVEKRSIAVQAVVRTFPEVGWKLLMAILPEAHQIGHYNPKPVWRDWFGSEWTGEVTRHEMVRQAKAYAELAVESGVNDVRKLDELIRRWNYLPRDAVDAMLNHLTSEGFRERPETERFVVWERLVNEIEKHRKYAKADWAMAEEELHRLESAAAVIAPASASIRNRRLFDEYDHHFYETEDYDVEREKLARRREQAVQEIIAESGVGQLLEIAAVVKQPVELGSSLGRIGTAEIDDFLLPQHLLHANAGVRELVRGYVWSRYFTISASWAEEVNVDTWTNDEKAQFFSFLPFHAVVWRLAEQKLGDADDAYWSRIYPNAFQAGNDLEEAIRHAIDHRRGDIAVSGINCMRFKKQPVSTALAVAAVKTLLDNYRKGDRIDSHELVEAIKLLQTSSDVDLEELARIEFKSLNVLDRFSGAAPVVLEKRLASDPEFFHLMVTQAFRSENEPAKEKQPNEREQEFAGHVFQLLYRWQTPPGTSDDKLDEQAFERWIKKVEELCKSSGHWPIAQQLIGTALVYAPAGLDGLLRYPKAAYRLDQPDADEMRRGFSTGLFNLRGVHGYSAGKEEMELATRFHDYAEKFEQAGFINIAATLRGLSESYKREAEYEAKHNP